MSAIALATVDTFRNQIIHTDAETLLRSLPSNSIHCIVTSPPYYGLRDYGVAGQIGMEDSLEQFVARLVDLFEEARRVLRPDGTLWLNMGDSYASDTKWGGSSSGKNAYKGPDNGLIGNRRWQHTGLKNKDLMGVPWTTALNLRNAGWHLRSDIVWCKTNPMPESVTDRPSVAHEYVFLLTKSAHYWYDADAIRTPLRPKTFTAHGCNHLPQKGDIFVRAKNWSDSVSKRKPKLNTDGEIAGANKRTVWEVAAEPSPIPHYAMFPQKLIEPMILAGCPAHTCANCGAPYQRIVQSEPMKVRRTDWGARSGNRTATSGTMLKPAQRRSLGFYPTCDCSADIHSGIVLDPFIGAGTTALVAMKHQRDFIGGDLSQPTVEIARKRIEYRGDDRRLIEEEAAGVQQLSLFSQEAS